VRDVTQCRMSTTSKSPPPAGQTAWADPVYSARGNMTTIPTPTSLAPDIIEAILRGDEPDGLSLEKLRKNLPVRWDEQRECWRYAQHQRRRAAPAAACRC